MLLAIPNSVLQFIEINKKIPNGTTNLHLHTSHRELLVSGWPYRLLRSMVGLPWEPCCNRRLYPFWPPPPVTQKIHETTPLSACRVCLLLTRKRHVSVPPCPARSRIAVVHSHYESHFVCKTTPMQNPETPPVIALTGPNQRRINPSFCVPRLN